MGKKKLWIILSGFLVILLCVLLACFFTGKEQTEEEQEGVSGLDFYSVTCRIEDYPPGEEVSWIERRYDLLYRKSKWYQNGEECSDSASISAGRVMDFPLAGDRQGALVELPEPVIESVYEMPLEDCRQYLLGLLGNGWKLRRVIYESVFVDVYLFDESGALKRALVTDGTMIMGGVVADYEFPPLEDYME